MLLTCGRDPKIDIRFLDSLHKLSDSDSLLPRSRDSSCTHWDIVAFPSLSPSFSPSWSFVASFSVGPKSYGSRPCYGLHFVSDIVVVSGESGLEVRCGQVEMGFLDGHTYLTQGLCWLSMLQDPLRGDFVASASCDRTLRVWSLLHMREVRRFDFWCQLQTVGEAASPGGSCLVGSGMAPILFYDLERTDADPLCSIRGHWVNVYRVRAVDGSRGGCLVATCSGDETGCLWDLRCCDGSQMGPIPTMDDWREYKKPVTEFQTGCRTHDICVVDHIVATHGDDRHVRIFDDRKSDREVLSFVPYDSHMPQITDWGHSDMFQLERVGEDRFVSCSKTGLSGLSLWGLDGRIHAQDRDCPIAICLLNNQGWESGLKQMLDEFRSRYGLLVGLVVATRVWVFENVTISEYCWQPLGNQE